MHVRARIGYTSPLAITEVFIHDFHAVMPSDVRLAITTLAVRKLKTEELEESLRLCQEMASAMADEEVDALILGGVPILLSAGGVRAASELIAEVGRKCGLPMTSSLQAQTKGVIEMGARRIGVVHPFGENRDAQYEYLREFDLDVVTVAGARRSPSEISRLSSDVPVNLARTVVRRHPEIDTLLFPCPHWNIIDRISELEQDLGKSVVTAGQAIFWQGLRTCGLDDQIAGYGRLLAEH